MRSDSGFTDRLNRLLAEANQPVLSLEAASKFEAYHALLIRWNQKINLTAIRMGDEILRRHFVESIAAAFFLPTGIRTLLDLGSGAGFPGLPIAICRPEISVVLAESQTKKAAFLREAIRTLAVPVEVFGARAETLARRFDCVTLRAVDKMGESVQTASGLVAAGCWLVLFTTVAAAEKIEAAAGSSFEWESPLPLPGADSRILLLGRKSR